jgi:hypothetical protein
MPSSLRHCCAAELNCRNQAITRFERQSGILSAIAIFRQLGVVATTFTLTKKGTYGSSYPARVLAGGNWSWLAGNGSGHFC